MKYFATHELPENAQIVEKLDLPVSQGDGGGTGVSSNLHDFIIGKGFEADLFQDLPLN